MSRKKHWTKHYSKPLSLTDLEKYLQDIFLNSKNIYSGPMGLVYEDEESEMYAIPGGGLTGRGGWELYNQAIKEKCQHYKNS